MTKFTDKSTTHMPLAFFFSAMEAFDTRMASVTLSHERFTTLKANQHSLYTAFDASYQRSQVSHLTKNITDLDKRRDHVGDVMMRVANLWATKLDDDELNIHGRRVTQVFKDLQFRLDEALVAENAKIDNIQQRFTEPQLVADLAAMGLTQLNTLFAQLSAQIKQLMSQRNEENSTIMAGEVKRTREALETHYAQFIVYLNALQEIMPEDALSLAAQYYNEDFRKIEQQLAQSRKKGNVSPSNAGTTPGDTPIEPDTPADPGTTTDPVTPVDPGTTGDDDNGGTDTPPAGGDGGTDGTVTDQN